MKIIFKDSFATIENGGYPDGWACEANCELPFKQGCVQDGQFHIAPVSLTTRHIPLTPELAEFEMELKLAGNSFFSGSGIDVYFHYDRETCQGFLLRYQWGITGHKTHYSQQDVPEYTCALYHYNGKPDWHDRKLFYDSYKLLGRKSTPGFVRDLAKVQNITVRVRANKAVMLHNKVLVGAFTLPQGKGIPQQGVIALSRSDMNGALSIAGIRIGVNKMPAAEMCRPETKTEFPAGINGIISPHYFRVAILRRGQLNILRMKLTGGPSKKPIYPDIDRQRFGEKMTNPYIRLEDGAGHAIDKFLICRADVGLNTFYWNRKCSVLNPSDKVCPVQREVICAEIPEDARIFIGYENYLAEDSIGNAGGPSEALIDAEGRVLWCGPAFPPGAVLTEVLSPADKAICARIPRDIPFYDDALAFAKRNHFFIENEPVRFQLAVSSRDHSLDQAALSGVVSLENVFGETMGKQWTVPFKNAAPIPGIAGATRYTSNYFNLPRLKVGVYHIRVKFNGIGGKPQERRAFEIMPEDPRAPSAPLASGLPELYPNILSGIHNEHFDPWSPAVVDTAHYNSGGNNYFKVARTWRAPDLLHAYGRKFNCWLKPWANIFEEKGIAPNRDLIAKSDACIAPFTRTDLWKPEGYAQAYTFMTLRKFLKSPGFRPVNGGSLCYKALAAAQTPGLSDAQFLELFEHHWKQWLLFFSAKAAADNRKVYDEVKAINPDCRLFSHGGNQWPPYGSGYKLGYFSLLTGADLRTAAPDELPGPNSFEDYPYSSGYPIAHGICHLMAARLEAPNRKLLPEIFGINGETLDVRVLFANPPYGRSDPPSGFLAKQFYEYSFAVVHFDKDGFHFWDDQGYHAKTWDRENYQEMLDAYAFISRVKPAKPLRAPAYAYSRDACLNTPDYYEKRSDHHHSCGCAVNAAEESVAFAYEQARAAGIQAGFMVRLEDCGKLDVNDVGLLVIPPLHGVDQKTIKAIRELHRKGVALLGFEDVSGLEDLFGVKKALEVKASKIFPAHDKWADLAGLCEKTEHPLCVIRHAATSAEPILLDAGGAPVLVTNNTEYGKTAMFTLPPTFVKRSRYLRGYGQKSNSVLVNRAIALVQKELADNAVETSEGTLIAFRDTEGDAHIIVSEDRCPLPGKPIRPLLKIKLPGIKQQDISADKEFEIVKLTSDSVAMRLFLQPYATARIKIRKSTMPEGR